MRSFIEELKLKIFPFIAINQKDYRIHGCSHISRCLVYANAICNLEKISDEEKLHVLYAVSFHDSGRLQDNGVDHYEQGNIDILRNYLSQENNLQIFDSCSSLMTKHNVNSKAHKIVYDTDVLDIMRPSCGNGGIYNFNRSYLKLLNDTNYCSEIINEAWQLISITDNIDEYNSFDTFSNMIALINANSLKFNLLCTQ